MTWYVTRLLIGCWLDAACHVGFSSRGGNAITCFLLSIIQSLPNLIALGSRKVNMVLISCRPEHVRTQPDYPQLSPVSKISSWPHPRLHFHNPCHNLCRSEEFWPNKGSIQSGSFITIVSSIPFSTMQILAQIWRNLRGQAPRKLNQLRKHSRTVFSLSAHGSLFFRGGGDKAAEMKIAVKRTFKSLLLPERICDLQFKSAIDNSMSVA